MARALRGASLGHGRRRVRGPRAVRGARGLGAARVLGATLALAAALALAPPARAQHPVAPTTRPLPVRADLADAIAVASVAKVEVGRIHLEKARALAGQVPERFEVKRSPGAPPPLAAGDRAILLLRGARPPYVLVDKPEETIRLSDAAAEARWTAAVSAWLAVRERPSAWIPLYLDWIEGGPDTLRELAVQGLLDSRAPFQPISNEVLAELGRAAWDTGRSLPARRTAALLARFGAGGHEPLARGFLAAPLDCDPTVAEAALQAAVGQADRDPSPVLIRGLDHLDAQVRKSALQAAQTLRAAASPQLRERIERMAREENESWLRAEAQNVLASLANL